MRKSIMKRKQGQGMTEYIIIIVLVAIAVLLGVKFFGETVREKFDGSEQRVDTDLDTNAP